MKFRIPHEGPLQQVPQQCHLLAQALYVEQGYDPCHNAHLHSGLWDQNTYIKDFRPLDERNE